MFLSLIKKVTETKKQHIMLGGMLIFINTLLSTDQINVPERNTMKTEAIKNVSFKNKQELTLRGSLWTAPSQSIIIMTHGAGDEKSSKGLFTELAHTFQKNNYNVLAYDMAGHGESDDVVFDLQQSADDVAAAIAFAKEQGFKDIVLLGHSLGGYGTLKSFDPSVKTLVLLGTLSAPMPFAWEAFCTPGQLEELNKTGAVTMPRVQGTRTNTKWAKSYPTNIGNIDQKELLKPVTCPVILIHGTADSYEQLFQKASQEALPLLSSDSKITIIPEATHDFLQHIPAVAKEITEWLTKHAPITK